MSTDREFSALAIELGDKIAELTLKQAKELADYLKDVHGIEAAAGGAVVMAAGPAAGAETAAVEQTEFTVVMDSFGDKKVEVIKVIRGLTGLGLKESKELVESAPCKIKEGVSKEEAEKIKADLEAAGAAVKIQ
ncbi:MAG: 50S ribosomal protein L7/L12 [Planctomycetia bacterium]|nr:50S ribosomal protein L7/L12 [Planctomycetia bacterium]